jgi:hypothetical protein
VHAVQAAHECGFAAAGWPNYGRGVVRGNINVDVVQRLRLAKPRVQLFDLDANSHN